jgi:type IV pilus assembly protein PilY1
MVYVGANDGALHGFHAETGNEVLRYFPGDLYEAGDKAGYHFLTDPDYDHLPYVDGTPVVSDAYIKTTPSGEESWRTVLVGTEGGGGSGLFALDITEPNIFNDDGTSAEDVVLWEFTQDNFADLGYTYSRPTIALLNDGRWAAITGNGDADDGLDGYLMILYLEGGIGDWSGEESVDDYIAIPTDEFGGLSSPTVIDTDGDGDADRAYAGDTEGNLWVFDLSSEDPDNWEVANGGDPLFENTRDDPQPITVKPTVVRHPTVPYDEASNAPNVMVLFGTGRLNTEDDKSDTAVQTFYGIWDRGDTNLTHSLNLVAQEFVFEDENTRITNPSLEVNYKSSSPEYGWYIDLLTDTDPIGERVVSDAVVRDDMIFFNTVIPTEDPCEYGGTGWMMSVRIENGGSSMSPVVDQNDDGLFNNEDTSEVTLAGDSEKTDVGLSGKKVEDDEGLPGGPAIIGDKLFTRGSKEGEEPKDTALAPVTGSTPVGRLSWEQLFPSP